VANGENRGKGYSVRHGMTEASGRFVLFTDADLSAPIEEADKLLAALGDHDVAIGSRALNRRLIRCGNPFFASLPASFSILLYARFSDCHLSIRNADSKPSVANAAW